jgi:hypothetical protein
MRPAPQEIISGISRILKETIEPQLTDEHALSRLREVRAVLAQVDWNDTTTKLGLETESVAAVLENWRVWTEADDGRAAAFAAQRARLDELSDESRRSPRYEAFAVLGARHARYGQLVVDVASATSRWARDEDGRAEAAEPILHSLRQHYSTRRG